MKTLVIALASAAFLVVACGGPSASSPSPSASTQPSPSTTASPAPSASARTGIDHEVVFLARDRLLPVARAMKGAGQGATAEARIYSRLDALWAVGRGPFDGAFNVVPLTTARLAKVTVNGQLATVDFTVANDDWSLGGSSQLRSFVQQLVYTASEEPGITQVLITQNGGKQAIIGGEGLEITGPATREQVSGYEEKGSTEGFISGESASFITDLSPRVSVDEVSSSLGRLTIEMRKRDDPTAKQFVPQVDVTVVDPKDWNGPELGKRILKVAVAKGADSVPGMRIVDRSPLRAVWTESALGGEGGGTNYYVGVDALVPWRVGLMFDPVRVVVDVGGDPIAVKGGTTIYAPRWGDTIDRTLTLSGLARAFEATVSWRAKDYTGAVVASGHTMASIGTSAWYGAYSTSVTLPATTKAGVVDLEAYQVSPRDGSEIDLARASVTLK